MSRVLWRHCHRVGERTETILGLGGQGFVRQNCLASKCGSAIQPNMPLLFLGLSGSGCSFLSTEDALLMSPVLKASCASESIMRCRRISSALPDARSSS